MEYRSLIALFFCWIFLFFNTTAQQSKYPFVPPAIERGDIHSYVDEDAEFPGGYKQLIHFFSKSFEYPETCSDLPTKFTIRFIVEKDGTVSFIQARPYDEMCFEEMLQQLQKWMALMPKWKPAIIEGEQVASYFILPINIHPK